jgi:FkbM family methyltransferase
MLTSEGQESSPRAVISKETSVTGQETFRGSMRGGLTHIKHLGFKPKTVIDVGAALGTFDLYEVFPESKHFLIEPIVENEPYLAQICRKLANAEYIIAAATREPGTVNLTVDPALVHSSISDNPVGSEGDPYQRTISAITLDQLCIEKKLEAPYLIKVDVDGKEVDVLTGATQILKDTEYVIVEVTLHEHMEKIMNFMKSQGFILYDIVDLSWQPSDLALSQCDMAFVKKSGQLKKNKSYIREDQIDFLQTHLKSYREKIIAYIEKNYSDGEQIVLSNPTVLTKEFRLSDINLIIFPDWSQSEDLLFQDLVNLLRVVATHPDKSHMTLLVDISNISHKDAELAISGVIMHLLMEEDLDVEDRPEISLIGNLSEMEWSVLLSHIHGRIILEHENQLMIPRALTETLPSYELYSLKDRQTASFFLN